VEGHRRQRTQGVKYVEGQVRLPQPVLEPDREYCATVALYERNDLATASVTSNSVCAAIINASASPDNRSIGKTSSGCALGAGNPSGFWALTLPALALLSALRIRRRRR
jgi:MYXO-CTERM domain-containing protein